MENHGKTDIYLHFNLVNYLVKDAFHVKNLIYKTIKDASFFLYRHLMNRKARLNTPNATIFQPLYVCKIPILLSHFQMRD